ncbi:homoserine O-acetyltransferase MetX [Rhodocaloribacter sp.]
MPHLLLPSLPLAEGATLTPAPVTYQTWGRLNDRGDNAILLCHTLTSNADAAQWWGPLLGPGRLFDTDRYFVVCVNNLGSPYGSASPLTVNPATGRPYGPDFPAVTIRDQVTLQKLVLDHLGVTGLALVTGPSMGGMMTLEWAFAGDFARALAPIAVGGRHSAWCIAWTEAQRQAIFADPRWKDGRYPPDAPPVQGLAAARMIAMLSYRTPADYDTRFGRRPAKRRSGTVRFSVESYLHHQGRKLVDRFDANCYVHLTRQLNTHDVARGRGPYADVLRGIRRPTLVIGVRSDLLYPPAEQEELAALIPNATLHLLDAPNGHDAFFMDFEGMEAGFRPFMERHVAPFTPPPPTSSPPFPVRTHV